MGDNAANTNISMKFCLIKKREGGKKGREKRGKAKERGSKKKKKSKLLSVCKE